MNTLNVVAAAKMMQVHPQTVLDLIAECAIPAAKVGRSYVILTKDVMAYLENAIVQQTAQRMRSPKKCSKVTAAKVGVSQHHAM